jgi:tRNA-binding protein
MENNLSWDDFRKSSNVCWTILIVNDFPTARNPAYQLTIDFEKLSELKTSAQITKTYPKKI